MSIPAMERDCWTLTYPRNAGDSEDDQCGHRRCGQFLSGVEGLHQHSARWTESGRPRLPDEADRQKESAAGHQS
jgi:hypothetical protein